MQLPSVEGLTPDILWYTIVGLVGIGALILLVDKVMEVFRKRRERKAVENTPSEKLADTISKAVLEKLEPRFVEIDRKLDTDKMRLDAHERRLSEQHSHIDDIEEGQKVICRGVLALLSHEINGNSDDKLRASQAEITNYLIDK